MKWIEGAAATAGWMTSDTQLRNQKTCPLSHPSLSSYCKTSRYEGGHTDTSLQNVDLFFLSNVTLKGLLKRKDAKEWLVLIRVTMCLLCWLSSDKSNKLTSFIQFQVSFFYLGILRTLPQHPPTPQRTHRSNKGFNLLCIKKYWTHYI